MITLHYWQAAVIGVFTVTGFGCVLSHAGAWVESLRSDREEVPDGTPQP